jgi:ADP-ribose pyrophosphatase YjhB (NUDIX family)
MIDQKMRISEAGLALIVRKGMRGENQYLTQWNDKWQAFSLVGGHRKRQESFRDCCIREIEEELGLTRNIDFQLAPPHEGQACEYMAFSQAARVETLYRFQLFVTEILTSEGMQKIDTNVANQWVGQSEIRNQKVSDGRSISDQLLQIVNRLNLS